MRLIDADELQQYLENCYNNHIPCQSEWESGAADTYTALADFVSDLPSKDAEPVVHAHWDDLYDPYDEGYEHEYYCTSCHCCGGHIPTHYCPHCGAKMDEEVSEDA